MRLRWGVVAAVLCAAQGMALANDPAPKFQPQDVFALRFAADPQVRPDGKHMAPRWSPDGTRLAYVAAIDLWPQLRHRHAALCGGRLCGGLFQSARVDRFRAAVAQKPVINWSSEVLTTDVTKFMAVYWFSKMPWEDPQGYWDRSPLSLVGNVTTPTMVVVGKSDYRTPVSEAEQYYQALTLKGVPTALMKVPGASHGGLAAKPSQSAEKALAILAWFDKHKKK